MTIPEMHPTDKDPFHRKRLSASRSRSSPPKHTAFEADPSDDLEPLLPNLERIQEALETMDQELRDAQFRRIVFAGLATTLIGVLTSFVGLSISFVRLPSIDPGTVLGTFAALVGGVITGTIVAFVIDLRLRRRRGDRSASSRDNIVGAFQRALEEAGDQFIRGESSTG